MSRDMISILWFLALLIGTVAIVAGYGTAVLQSLLVGVVAYAVARIGIIDDHREAQWNEQFRSIHRSVWRPD